MVNNVKYIELFAGVGGFRLGIERATKATCVFTNEWDKYAAQTYNKNFGGTIDQRSITDIPTSDIPDHDLLVGGFPCQSFSVAGKRGGFNDTRGTMFFEIARILADKKPQHLLLENVKGLLSHDEGRTFQTILGVLADLGYRVEWQVLNSKDFGVPQNRERILIIGHLGACCGRQVFPLGGYSKALTKLPGQYSNTLTARYYAGQANGTYVIEREFNAQVEQLNNPTHSNDRVYGASGLSPMLNTMQGGRRQPLVEVERAPLKFLGRSQKNIRGDYAFTVDTMNTGGVKVAGRIRRLTPTECERLQGFPDGWTAGVSDSQRYKQMGNAVTTNVIEAVVRGLYA